MKIEKKNILVVGAGKSGLASAVFLKKRGASVMVTDVKPEHELIQEKRYLDSLEIPYRFGGHPEDIFLNQDVIVISPGVPRDSDLFVKVKEKGIEVIGEVELASRFISTPMIAITGTNGKTTTTTLLGEILKDNGVRVFVGGNIGTPLIEYADDDSMDLVVVEVSSFQLETIDHFHPYGGILLNITPDHLDRYAGMKDYAEAKLRLFENQEPFDFAVLGVDDKWVMKYKPSVLADIYTFSTRKTVKKGAYYKDGKIFFKHPALKNTESVDAADIKLKGLHNMENIMAASLAALETGVPLDGIRGTLKRFEGLHHRVELVNEINCVTFYDDSKGTNLGAVEKALEGFDRPVVLILGGRDKGADYDYLNNEIKRTVRTVVAVGEAKDKIYSQLSGVVNVIKTEGFEEAVRTAFRQAGKGDAVLLSPACSSFDMFKSYTERGEKFVEIVRKIRGEAVGKN
jgi:UDP-N-acetylmuramoylalanine--D-glutamate ligase